MIEGRALAGSKSHYTDSHHRLHQLVRSTTHGHLTDFEIAVPELMDFNGNHISHTLTHNRVRRSTAGSSTPLLGLRAHGHDFRLSLEDTASFLAPTFSVKRRRRSTRSGEIEEVPEPSSGLDCHFTARMISHQNRTAGVSVCGGSVSGLLRTSQDDFIIEPISDKLSHDFPEPQRPHVVYKRKHLGHGKQKMHYCGKQKRHPTAISSDVDAQIRHLSDGAIVLKSHEQVENEYEKIDGKGDNLLNLQRSKRSIAENSRARRRRVVETLVVADSQLVKNHAHDRVDVTTYILTVMNMVTSLFKDGTLDSDIEISLIGITLLEDDKELRLGHRADKSLSNFCYWQSTTNTSTGRRPDHSILLTGIDICIDQNRPCDTLGLAQIGGMCSKSDSCTINEDMGLGLAFTVAHETGHSFGMSHDSQGNSCSKRDGHIMSPTLNTHNGVFTWSACSRKSMQKFIRSHHADCLDDGLQSPAALTVSSSLRSQRLPGELYSAREQCVMQLGQGVDVCLFRHMGRQKNTMCKALWCQRSNGVCETKFMPAAEGTECGRNMWCRRGECVPRSSSGPVPVNGGWSNFDSWSTCTRTCGGGVRQRKRECNNPLPRYGGRYCDGEDTIYELCNTEACPTSAIDFRAQQCAQFNSKPYRKQYFSWIPYKKYWKYDLNRCELLCEAEGYAFFDRLAAQVVDGTSCDEKSNDVCIAGQCVHVGCDNVLNSNATVDACGVCNGDNSTCQFIDGTFRDDVEDSGYYKVTRIPAGATSIRIWEEECCTHTYIAVRSATDTNRYYLNGNWRVDLYGEISFAGAKWMYKRQTLHSELLTTDGPIEEDIIVEALIVRKNPGISFSYAIQEINNALPYEEPAPVHTYSWEAKKSACSKSCAGGLQRIEHVCIEDHDRLVDDSQCANAKPDMSVVSCNPQPCPATWHVEDWGQCSRTCGGGLQTRRVTCRRMTSSGEEYVSPNQCDLTNKPRRSQICAKDECPAKWQTTRWSQCSRSCGRGFRTREVTCRSGTRRLDDTACGLDSKPHGRKSCIVSYCPKRFQWFITSWSRCSTRCGEGTQRRQLRCTFKNVYGRYKSVNPRKCSRSPKPKISLSKSCNLRRCPTTTTIQPTTTAATTAATTTIPSRHVQSPHIHYKSRINRPPSSSHVRWITAPWSQCSATCGGGRQTRFVRCLANGRLSPHLCAGITKPESERTCNTNECLTNPDHDEPPCKDKYKWCSLVPQHNQCSHKFFGAHCCQSCKTR